MIAAIALAHGLTLLTHNTREFDRVSEITATCSLGSVIERGSGRRLKRLRGVTEHVRQQ
jgi:hypothetical protein